MVESAAPSPGRIFISYRREESAYPAGWLYDRLAGRYGDSQIFKDVDSIELGDDFVEVITSAVGNCDVLLALVGDEWLTITDADGRRRLDDPNDFVRLEIEAALTRNVRVIPILVDGSRMPHAEEVPASLAGLARRQALELSPARFDFDTGRLLKVLDKTLAEVRTADDTATSVSEPAAKAADPSTTELPTAAKEQEQIRQSRISDVDLFPPEALPPSTGEPTDSRAPASTPTRIPHSEGPQASPQSPPEAHSPPPTAPAPPKRAMWKFSGIAALASSALMLLCIVLPQQYGTSTIDKDPIKATYLLCLGLIVLLAGSLTLTARWRIHGLGGVIGAASVSTVVAFDMVNTLDRIGSEQLGLGFWAAFVAPLVLLAAGVLAVAAARRESDAGFAAFQVSDWTSWVVLGLAVAAALVLIPAAMDTYSSLPGWGLQGIWLAVLAVAVPLTALLTRPVLLGRWLLMGWAFACATLVLPIWMSWDAIRRLLAWHVVRHAHTCSRRLPSPDNPPQPQGCVVDMTLMAEISGNRRSNTNACWRATRTFPTPRCNSTGEPPDRGCCMAHNLGDGPSQSGSRTWRPRRVNGPQPQDGAFAVHDGPDHHARDARSRPRTYGADPALVAGC